MFRQFLFSSVQAKGTRNHPSNQISQHLGQTASWHSSCSTFWDGTAKRLRLCRYPTSRFQTFAGQCGLHPSIWWRDPHHARTWCWDQETGLACRPWQTLHNRKPWEQDKTHIGCTKQARIYNEMKSWFRVRGTSRLKTFHSYQRSQNIKRSKEHCSVGQNTSCKLLG